MATQSSVSFSSPEAAGQWAKGLLVATFVLAAVGVVSGLLQLELLSRAASGGISDAEAAANDSRQQLIGLLQILLFIGTAVAFLIWFHRAHKNLPVLGSRELLYTPGWAVGGFFVPFLNLVRPFQVMREVWHGSNPARLEPDTAAGLPAIGGHLGTPSLVGWWWALFLVSGFVGNIAVRIGFPQDHTLAQLQNFSRLLVYSDLLDIPSALVAIRLVGRITSWQVERARLVHQRGSQPPAAPAVGSFSITS
jgi:hypothetical protein